MMLQHHTPSQKPLQLNFLSFIVRVCTPSELMACSDWIKPLQHVILGGPIRAHRCLGSAVLNVLMHSGKSTGNFVFLAVESRGK